MRDNILESDTGYGIYVADDSQQGFASDDNLFYSAGGGNVGYWQTNFGSLRDWSLEVGQDLHSRSANPTFLDAADGDFHLAARSPGVDAGDPAADFSLEPLPNGGRMDVGAYGDTPEATPSASAGVIVEQNGGKTKVAVGGGDATYSIVLTSAPTADVNIAIHPDVHLMVDPPALTFTIANWDVAQTISVHALPDTSPEPPRTVAIDHSATSTDARYQGITIPNLEVTLADDVVAAATGSNQPPSFSPGGDETVDEDAGPQSVAGWASQISAGSDSSVGFTVTADSNSSLFSVAPAIDASTGTLTFTPAQGAAGSATITLVLRGTSPDGTQVSSDPATFTITVNPVDQPPTFVAGSSQTVAENAGPQSVAGWASQISAGSESSLGFDATSDSNPSLFWVSPAVDASTGTLTFTPAQDAAGSATITLVLQGIASDGTQESSAPATFTITVNPVDQPPAFVAGPTQTVAENAGSQSVADWASQISAGSDTTIGFDVTSDSNPSLFSVSPAVDTSTGTLTFTPAQGAAGSATITLVLQGIASDGTQESSAPATFTITVNPVDEPPTFVAGPSQTIAENAGPQSVAGWASQISAGSDSTIAFDVTSDSEPSLFAVAPAIDSSTGTLAFAPAQNAAGSATITLVLQGTVSDGTQESSAPATFTITVNPVNQPPAFSAGSNQTVAENAGPQTVAGWASNISAGPPNEASQALTFVVTNDTNGALFSVAPSVDPTNGNLSYTPAPNAAGTATITLELKDNGGTDNGGQDTSQPQTFTITVTPSTAPASQLQFSVPQFTVSRQAGTIELAVTRTGSTSQMITVHYATSDGTAHAGTDYVTASGDATFQPGDLSATIPITITGGAASADESFTVALSDPTNGATLNSPTTATVTISAAAATDVIPSNLVALANQITHSAESYTYFISQAYELYLHRALDTQGLSYWLNKMENGYSDEHLEAGFLSSAEYIKNHGGAGGGWIDGMYEDLLGRVPDEQGHNYRLGQFAAGVTGFDIALGFAQSKEREGLRIASDYEIYLGRALDAQGHDYWVDQFVNHGAQNESVVGGFVGGPEYYKSATRGQSNRAIWVASAIDEVFHRAATQGDISHWTSLMK